MLRIVRKALSSSVITKVFKLYSTSTNLVLLEQNGDRLVDRHTIGLVGKFMLSKFSRAEFAMVWEEVQPLIEKELDCPVDLVYARVLKYNQTCAIPNHLDSHAEGQDSDLSVIIQITDSAQYRGGDMIVSKQLMDLELGDMVFYTYDEPHEVKPIKEGIRYVINLRCKMVK